MARRTSRKPAPGSPRRSRQKENKGASQRCREFLEQYHALGFPPLQSDTLYCLPSAVLKSVFDVAECSDLIRGPHRRFETELAGWCQRQGAAGIFAGRPVPIGLLDMTEIAKRNKNRRDLRSYEAKIQRRRHLASSLEEPEPYTAPPGSILASRLRAYGAWLLLNPAYLKDLQRLRRAANKSGATRGGFAPPMAPGASAEAPGWDPGFHRAYLSFCRKWCLSGLYTWELPVPVPPALVSQAGQGRDFLRQTGLSVFVPVTLDLPAGYLTAAVSGWRGEAIKADQKGRSQWGHLRSWLDGGYKRSSRGINYGDLFLVMHFWRVLTSRYCSQIAEGGKMGLYEAFGQFLEGAGASPVPKRYEGLRSQRPGFEKVRKMVSHLNRFSKGAD